MTIGEILKATSGELINGNNKDFEVLNFSDDTRMINNNDFFIPICGENFDGHNFIDKAFDSGACGCFTSKEVNVKEYTDKYIIKVKDTLKAFQDLASFYIRKLGIPVVTITGSVGKTSTKDMVASVLSQKYTVTKTKENYNNFIGLPRTILSIRDEQIAVVEIGMNSFGEISLLSKISNPETAVITNIGMSHIGLLGSQENIFKAKMEVLDGLQKDGTLIVNGDDKFLATVKGNLYNNVIEYGINSDVFIKAMNIKTDNTTGSSFDININNKVYHVTVPVPGMHFVYNALCAIAVGLNYEVPMDKIIEGITSFSLSKNRMDILDLKNDIHVINDVYNASPDSMKAGINTLNAFKGSRKIAILGDMLELGDFSQKAHFDVGEYAYKANIDYVFAVGSDAKNIIDGAISSGMSNQNAIWFENKEVLCSYLKDFIGPCDCILVKASRRMKFEDIVKFICDQKEK